MEESGRLGNGVLFGGIVRIALVTVAVISMVWVSSAGQGSSWTTKNYHVLVDGNDLYSKCQMADKNVRLSGEFIETQSSASGSDLFLAGNCWGYITAVVDSIPEGEDFDPDTDVRLSQYVDVVLAYLRAHPESRHLPAHALVRYALAGAFPARAKH
jgi:hypothetical protein